MKQLIICPHCEEEGKKNILAEIDGNRIEILRRINKTIIITQECLLICGDCGKVVYRKVNYDREQRTKDSTNNGN